MPIENVQIGDRVLSQSPLSGELTFKPVLDITLGHQEFVAVTTTEKDTLLPTGGHLFWVSGAGWRMAKELKVGDRLHTVSGWSEIQNIEPADAGETHNLVVADFNTYFVGNGRVLTHDITVPQMVTGGVPGELAAR
jgi:intein/homing endonuclease